MNHTGQIVFIVFIVAYIIFWGTIICIGIPKEERKRQQKRYDERQITEQGRASKYAYITLIVYLVFYSILDVGFDFIWCEQIFGIFLGIMFSLSVYLAYCIFQDAYFSIGESKPGALIGVNVIGLSQLLMAVECIEDGSIVENGIISADGLHILFVALILLLDAFVMIRNRMDKHSS